jgi:hypothetical protein
MEDGLATMYTCETVQVTPLFLKLATTRWAGHFLSFVKALSSIYTDQLPALSTLALVLEDIYWLLY